jgi:hypothetical protein
VSTALNAIVTHRIEVASGLIILRLGPEGFVEATRKQPGQVHAAKYWEFGFLIRRVPTGTLVSENGN